MSKTIIGVMGPGNSATASDLSHAFELGKLIAAEGWVLLSGGRSQGVMDAVNRGCKSAGGLTVGILPTDKKSQLSESVDIAIVTGMGSARNNINILSSDVIVAVGAGSGTASEVCLALKAGKDVILVCEDTDWHRFFQKLDQKRTHSASSPAEAMEMARNLLSRKLSDF